MAISPSFRGYKIRHTSHHARIQLQNISHSCLKSCQHDLLNDPVWTQDGHKTIPEWPQHDSRMIVEWPQLFGLKPLLFGSNLGYLAQTLVTWLVSTHDRVRECPTEFLHHSSCLVQIFLPACLLAVRRNFRERFSLPFFKEKWGKSTFFPTSIFSKVYIAKPHVSAKWTVKADFTCLLLVFLFSNQGDIHVIMHMPRAHSLA